MYANIQQKFLFCTVNKDFIYSKNKKSPSIVNIRHQKWLKKNPRYFAKYLKGKYLGYFTIEPMLICFYTYYHNSFDNLHSSHYPSILDYPNTIAQFSQFLLQIVNLAPNQVHSSI